MQVQNGGHTTGQVTDPIILQRNVAWGMSRSQGERAGVLQRDCSEMEKGSGSTSTKDTVWTLFRNLTKCERIF